VEEDVVEDSADVPQHPRTSEAFQDERSVQASQIIGESHVSNKSRLLERIFYERKKDEKATRHRKCASR
jgi:hypothetical protein